MIVSKHAELNVEVNGEAGDAVVSEPFALQQRVAELERALIEQEQEVTVLRVQRDLTVALNDTNDLSHALTQVLEAVLQFHTIDCGGIYLLDPSSGDLSLAYQSDIPAHLLEHISRYSAISPVTQRVMEGIPLYCATHYHPDVRNLLRQAGILALASIPILHRQQVIALLVLASRSQHEIPPTIRQALEIIAAQAGGVIARIMLLEQTERRLKRVQALRNVEHAITACFDLDLTLNILLNHVTDHLNVDAAIILLLNQQTRMLEYAAGLGIHTPEMQQTRLALGEGYAGRVALERCVVSVPDVRYEGDGIRTPLIESEGLVAYFGMPLIAKGQVKGVLELFHRAPMMPDQEWLDFLQTLSGKAALALDNAEMFEQLQQSNEELMHAYDTTIEGWARALELRDAETEGHSRRVTALTLQLAQAMGVSDDDLVHIYRGAILHDIGKMAIPDSILLKPSSLSEEEHAIMKQHTIYAYHMLFPIPFLRPALDIPYCHHEKWDGSGYPRGLRGEEIPLAARIFAVVDVWDALLSERPYRKGWTKVQARAYIRKQAGKHFDPHVVEVFLRLVSRRGRGGLRGDDISSRSPRGTPRESSKD